MRILKYAAILLTTTLLISCNNSGSSGNQEFTEKEKTSDGKLEGVVVHLNKATFLEKVFNYETSQEWKYQGDMPAIIDFYADWCKPCKMVAPIMEDLAAEYKGRIRIYKVNTDQEKELAGAFQIQSIPAVLFIPKKGQPQMSVGALPKEEYVNVIEKMLLPSMNQQ